MDKKQKGRKEWIVESEKWPAPLVWLECCAAVLPSQSRWSRWSPLTPSRFYLSFTCFHPVVKLIGVFYSPPWSLLTSHEKPNPLRSPPPPPQLLPPKRQKMKNCRLNPNRCFQLVYSLNFCFTLPPLYMFDIFVKSCDLNFFFSPNMNEVCIYWGRTWRVCIEVELVTGELSPNVCQLFHY